MSNVSTELQWKPKYGERFWNIQSSGEVFSHPMCDGYGEDCYRIGNCYRTEEEAKARIPAVRAAYQGKSLKGVLGDVVKENEVFISPAAIRAILAAWESK
jgi:hypothetical protein